jgi:cadmium resistance protein CadD (predicted permease)
MNEGVKEKNVGRVILTGIISFVATNADDFIVLINFFLESSIGRSSLRVIHIIIGQYLGFSVLLSISLIGYFVSFVIPVSMLGFLGWIPLLLGLKQLLELLRDLLIARPTIDEIVSSNSISTVELEMIRYRKDSQGDILFEIRRTTHQEEEERIALRGNLLCSLRQILKVTTITIANSGDNIAIYTPLFGQSTRWELSVYLLLFVVLISLWLIITYFFLRFQPIFSLLERFSRYLVPLVFIAIGISILVTSECFPWLIRAIQTKNFAKG